MNTSIMLADAESSSQAGVMHITSTIILAVSAVMFAVVAAGVMLPSASHVLRTKQRLFTSLLEDVPVEVVRALQAQSQKRIDVLTTSADDDYQSEVDEDDAKIAVDDNGQQEDEDEEDDRGEASGSDAEGRRGQPPQASQQHASKRWDSAGRTESAAHDGSTELATVLHSIRNTNARTGGAHTPLPAAAGSAAPSAEHVVSWASKRGAPSRKSGVRSSRRVYRNARSTG